MRLSAHAHSRDDDRYVQFVGRYSVVYSRESERAHGFGRPQLKIPAVRAILVARPRVSELANVRRSLDVSRERRDEFRRVWMHGEGKERDADFEFE